jgi:hypothetical protein
MTHRAHASHLTVFQGLATFFSQLDPQIPALDGVAGQGLGSTTTSAGVAWTMSARSQPTRGCSWEDSDNGVHAHATDSGVLAQQGFTHAFRMVLHSCDDLWSLKLQATGFWTELSFCLVSVCFGYTAQAADWLPAHVHRHAPVVHPIYTVQTNKLQSLKSILRVPA